MAVKKVKVRKARKSSFRFLVCGLLSIFIISAVLGSLSKTWIDIYEKYKEKSELENKLVLLEEEYEGLSIDVEKLQDPEYVSRYLKEKYFYSGEDEYIIRLPQVKSNNE